MGAFEVTRGQWRRVATFPKVRYDLGRVPRSDMPEALENSLPVDTLYFFEAEEFCARVSRAMGRPYRLPSEAEWEYACRAGTMSAHHFGDGISLEVAVSGPLHNPEPVGSRNAPNAFGLHDMHGNVAEWCSDWQHRSYHGTPTDGSAWIGSGLSEGRVIRGGAYGWAPTRSAARRFWLWNMAASGLGFRVALGPCRGLTIPKLSSRRRP
jgi:formylglycine-generating enzyme required for sulfatase activity